MSTAAKTRWPTMSDYQEAVQSPPLCFSDSELKGGTPFTDKLGLPRPICGQFASVYEIETGKRRYAVKCFLRNIPDQHGRYAKISEHINRQRTPYFVTFEYQNEGIRVHGALRPLVKMAWIEGLALNEFIENNLSSPRILLDLEKRWLTLLDHLRGVRIAHGDLQHGNVIVAGDGSLRLIDYDGMWVPALEGQKSHETGHPDFQSPRRADGDFHEEIDFFAGAVVQIAIRALSKDPKLWERHNNGDNLLFRRQDYLDPAQSSLLKELRALGDSVIDEKLRLITQACARLPRRGELARLAGGAKAEKKRKKQKKQKNESPRNEASKPHKKTRPAPVAPGPQRDQKARAAVPWLEHAGGSPLAAGQAAAAKGRAAGTAPRPGSSRRRPGLFRFALHLCVVAPVALPQVAEWMELLYIDPDSMTFGQRVVFGALSFLGVLSLITLLIFRRFHRTASGRFFGFMTLLGIYDIAFKLWTHGMPSGEEGSLDPYHFSAGLVALSFLGWLTRPRAEKPPASTP